MLLKGSLLLFQVRGKMMLSCFDILSVDCACTNLKLIDFPVQRFTYAP